VSQTLEAELIALKKCKAEMNETTRPLTEMIAKLSEEVELLSKPFREEIAKHEETIRNAALVMEESYTVDGVGKVTYRKGYERVSWDDAALQGYMTGGHPELEQYRKTTFVKPTVMISV